MKKLLQSYISFTRIERMGIICLCSVIIILIAIKATMPLWVHPDIDEVKQKQLIASWEAFKRSQPASANNLTTNEPHKEFQDAGDQTPTPLPDTININTADSATLVRLKSIGPVTAHKIILRRTMKGPFTNILQLTEVGSFSEETLQLLKKHIIFSTPSH